MLQGISRDDHSDAAFGQLKVFIPVSWLGLHTGIQHPSVALSI